VNPILAFCFFFINIRVFRKFIFPLVNIQHTFVTISLSLYLVYDFAHRDIISLFLNLTNLPPLDFKFKPIGLVVSI
jgi:hypothetical protein